MAVLVHMMFLWVIARDIRDKLFIYTAIVQAQSSQRIQNLMGNTNHRKLLND